MIDRIKNFNNKRRLVFYFFLFQFCGIVLFSSCSKEDDIIEEPFECTEAVSYANDVSPILKNTCAISGCHVASFSGGNFNEYEDIKSRVGMIINNVFVLMTMPPENTAGPKELTEEELEILDCWIGNGALDN